MTPCQRFREDIFDLYDGELDILRKRELQRHLKECPQCTHFLNELRLLRSHLKELTPVRTSESFKVLLRERIRREMAGKRKKAAPSVFLTRRLIPAFGLAFLVMMVGFFVLDRKKSFLGSSGGETRISRSSISSRKSFDGRVYYVIDDFPNRVSLSRSEEGMRTEFTDEDSLLSAERLDDLRARLTPVSF